MRERAGIAAVALIALMAIGSVMLWIGAPLLWLWIASRVAESSQPSMGPYAIVVIGVPLTAVVLGKWLARLDRAYARVTHAEPDERVERPWLRSMRGARVSERRRTVLDVVMIASVSVAGAAFMVWFFLFAGSSLPGG